jgi:hypothetical protein
LRKQSFIEKATVSAVWEYARNLYFVKKETALPWSVMENGTHPFWGERGKTNQNIPYLKVVSFNYLE